MLKAKGRLVNNIYFAFSKYFGNFNSLLCHFPTLGQCNTQNIPWSYSVEQGRNMNKIIRLKVACKLSNPTFGSSSGIFTCHGTPHSQKEKRGSILLFFISMKSKSYETFIVLFFWHWLLGCSVMHKWPLLTWVLRFSLSIAVN